MLGRKRSECSRSLSLTSSIRDELILCLKIINFSLIVHMMSNDRFILRICQKNAISSRVKVLILYFHIGSIILGYIVFI